MPFKDKNKRAEYQKKYKAEHKEMSRVYDKRKKIKRMENGKCKTCGVFLIEDSGNMYCVNCLEDAIRRTFLRKELYRGF